MSVVERFKRVERFFSRLRKSPAFNFDDAPDPRQPGKVKHPMKSLIDSLFGGLVHNCLTLRDVEQLQGTSAPMTSAGQPSDTTLFDIVPRIDEAYLENKLVQGVKHMNRKKMLKGSDLPLSVIAVDGKNLGMLTHDGAGKGHHRNSPAGEKWGSTLQSDGHYVAPVLRAVLVSAEQRPIIMQKSIPAGTGEAAVFGDFIKALDTTYSRCGFVDVISGDAGLCSLNNANIVDDAGATYIFGLKGNQPSLLEAAQHFLEKKAKQSAPAAQSPIEKRSGAAIQRLLYQTHEMQEYETSVGAWVHLTEAWLVRQITTYPNGKENVEDRYFLTNIAPGRLTPKQKLMVVRAHWRIENDAFNSLDMQWKEDFAPWCRTGAALWNLGLLRCMAYNLVQHLRRCHLRKKHGTPTQTAIPPWNEVFAAIAMTVTCAHLMAMQAVLGTS